MMIFTSIYSVIDGLFVSNFAGKTALAAINIIYPFIMAVGALGFMMGTGGTPEGVLAACAIKGAGGAMLARLDPQSEAEKAAIQEAGIDLAQILDADTLVQGDDVFFAATGISGGTFLRGVQFSGQGAVTHSMIIRSKTGTMRYIESHHNWNKLMQISSIKYD